MAPGDSKACGRERSDPRNDLNGEQTGLAGGLDMGCGEGGKNQGDAWFGARAPGRMELPSDVGKAEGGAGVCSETVYFEQIQSVVPTGPARGGDDKELALQV